MRQVSRIWRFRRPKTPDSFSRRNGRNDQLDRNPTIARAAANDRGKNTRCDPRSHAVHSVHEPPPLRDAQRSPSESRETSSKARNPTGGSSTPVACPRARTAFHEWNDYASPLATVSPPPGSSPRRSSARSFLDRATHQKSRSRAGHFHVMRMQQPVAPVLVARAGDAEVLVAFRRLVLYQWSDPGGVMPSISSLNKGIRKRENSLESGGGVMRSAYWFEMPRSSSM